MSRRKSLPNGDWVDLPDEWLGKHLLYRDNAVEALSAIKQNTLLQAGIGLALTDNWNISEITSRDPHEWKVDEWPLVLVSWLAQEVFVDFARAFYVPKV
jgi:hypothetical protein